MKLTAWLRTLLETFWRFRRRLGSQCGQFTLEWPLNHFPQSSGVSESVGWWVGLLVDCVTTSSEKDFLDADSVVFWWNKGLVIEILLITSFSLTAWIMFKSLGLHFLCFWKKILYVSYAHLRLHLFNQKYSKTVMLIVD